jgi:hypothetical protein
MGDDSNTVISHIEMGFLVSLPPTFFLLVAIHGVAAQVEFESKV